MTPPSRTTFKTSETLFEEFKALANRKLDAQDSGEMIQILNLILEENRKKHRCLFENMQSAFSLQKLLFHEDGNPSDFIIVDINREFENRTGLKKEELLNQRASRIIPEIFQEILEIFKEFHRVSHKERAISMEKFFPSLDKWFSINVFSTEPGYCATIFTNITKRKVAEETLRASENKFRAIFESAKDSIFIKDRDLRYTHINKAMEKLFNFSRQDLVGKTDEFIFGEIQSKKIKEKDKLVLSGEVLTYDSTRSINGTNHSFHTIKVPLKNAKGEIFGLCGISRDITGRKQNEEKLHIQQERYELSTKAGRVGVWDWNLETDEFYLDPIIKEFLGYEDDEIPNDIQVWSSYIHPEDTQPVMSAAQSCIEGKTKEYVYEHRMIHKDGGIRWIGVHGNVIRNGKGKPMRMLGTDTDITERKFEEEAKQRLEEQLRHALKMEALGTLAGGIAHEFNNMLGTIIGFSELTIENLPKDSKNRRNLEKVLLAAGRATEMVKQILAFSRKEEEVRRPIYLSHIINEALSLIYSSLPSTIDIRAKIEESTQPVLADQTQIHQVIMNLCANAAHAMKEEGGILEIVLKEIEFQQTTSYHKELSPGRYQQLTISDTGHGMEEETLSRVFEPYFTTKKVGEGTGMGLAVVHGIVKNYRGEITIHSDVGKGTIFHIFLPLIQQEKALEEEEAAVAIQGGTERILFVDDEPELAEVSKKMLEKLGYKVVMKSDSIEALETFRLAPEQFDLVITDQTMPHMTGVKLVKELRSIRTDIPVILCTGFSEAVGEENYMAYGINAFVMKPILKKEIAAVIRRALDNKS